MNALGQLQMHCKTCTLLSFAVLLLLSGCKGTAIPDGITAVEDFDLERYLGQWYEIARLNHSFEEGLSNVTARYEPRDDGGVRVTNTGYSAADEAWDTAEGKAFFVGEETTAHLKVSFFGPFYGSYIVFELDKSDYQYAFVAGPSKEYLWLLARTPQISDELTHKFVTTAKELGFDTDQLIFVDHRLKE